MNEVTWIVDDGGVIDLAAASELTMGFDDPVMRESLVMPHTRDF